LAIKLIHQIVLGLEVGKQGSFRHTGGMRYCRGCSAQPPLGEDLGRGSQDRVALVMTTITEYILTYPSSKKY
jgi:hypothetical protein